jgi:MFS family permease
MTSSLASGLREMFSAMLRPLAHRDYRLFFGGQCVSQVGTWMQQMTVIWLAYRLTGDALLVGVVGFCAQFPTFALSPLAGVWADRFDRRRLLLLTQTLAMFQALTLAALTLGDAVTIWTLMLLVALLGAINALDMTASQAFVKELVRQREDLGSAIALNSSIVNGARLIGPALAGLVIRFTGEGGCFLLNGLSFLAVLVALGLMRPATVAPAAIGRQPLWRSLREGVAYTFENRPVRDLLALVGLLALFGMPYSLLPVFARDVLHGNADELGLLMGAGGLGALAATLRMAARRSVIGAESGLIWAGMGLTASLMLLGAVDQLWLALLCRLLAGYCVILQVTTASTLVQTLVADEQRGRVTSFYTMALLGALPLGNLLAGALAGFIGVAETFVVSGICCLAGVVWFWLRLAGFRAATRLLYERFGLMHVVSAEQVGDAGLTTGPH